eukprot:TRINITY_DN17318_c0_g1_i1.p1 TRINITY_DN17318_c0_g1~~TRINITY_DN17318_c0_g1_i1.p1  ORF type:complete len:262 (-),score=77.17 TRINITY_DN17318_c0_g1_i1:46-714(-)
MEYLRRVRWETRHCPAVVVSKAAVARTQAAAGTPGTAADVQRFAQLTEFAPAPEGLAPLPAWEAQFCASFCVLRDRLAAVNTVAQLPPSPAAPFPSLKDGAACCAYCFGATTAGKDGSDAPLNPPLMVTVTALDHVSVVRLLDHMVNYVAAHPIRQHYVPWLFAVLARLDLPLDPDTASNLRMLLRLCCTRRAALDSPQDPLLPGLNILITILAKVFAQSGQ